MHHTIQLNRTDITALARWVCQYYADQTDEEFNEDNFTIEITGEINFHYECDTTVTGEEITP